MVKIFDYNEADHLEIVSYDGGIVINIFQTTMAQMQIDDKTNMEALNRTVEMINDHIIKLSNGEYVPPPKLFRFNSGGSVTGLNYHGKEITIHLSGAMMLFTSSAVEFIRAYPERSIEDAWDSFVMHGINALSKPHSIYDIVITKNVACIMSYGTVIQAFSTGVIATEARKLGDDILNCLTSGCECIYGGGDITKHSEEYVIHNDNVIHIRAISDVAVRNYGNDMLLNTESTVEWIDLCMPEILTRNDELIQESNEVVH